MAIQDYTSFLGKRVGFTMSVSGEPDTIITGVIIATVNYAEGYDQYKDNSVFFLEDGYSEPDFALLSSYHGFHVIE